MASKTRAVIGVSIVVALVFLAVGIVIGFFTAKASTKASQQKESCSGENLSTEAASKYLKVAAESRARTLMTTSELQQLIKDGAPPGVQILDVTYNTKEVRNDSYRQLYRKSKIPYSLYYDAWQCVNRTELIPNNLPDRACFEEYIQSLGITANTHVVVYDRIGTFSAWKSKRDTKPSFRTWWLFRVHGHRKISILDGGLHRWEEDNYRTTSDIPEIRVDKNDAEFKVKFDDSLIKSYEDMLDIVKNKKAQIVDSRSPVSATVIDPENDGGYLPCAKFLPAAEIFQKDGTVRPNNQLLQLISIKRIDLDQPVVTSCMTGMSATIAAGVLHVLGKDAAVYYGSWTEWRRKADETLKMRTPT